MKEYNFKINGTDYAVSIENIDDATAEVTVNGASFNVEFEGMGNAKPKKIMQVEPMPSEPGSTPSVIPTVSQPTAETIPASPVKSPLPGVIVDIKVKVGDSVKSGDHLMVLEAMKMENNIDSDRDGIIREIKVSRGDTVLEGDLLVMIE